MVFQSSSGRVVVTGMGIVSPLGVGVEPVWSRLISGASGLIRLSDDIVPDIDARVGGMVPTIGEDEAGLDIDAVISTKDRRKMDRFIVFAKQERTATVIASGIGGFHTITEAVRTVDTRGSGKLSPFTVPAFLVNLAAGHVSIRYGFKGPIGAPVTACAASVQAIGDGMRLLRTGEADVVVAGGAEACVNRVALGGFAAARGLSTSYNDTPQRASRPFDRDRDRGRNGRRRRYPRA